MKKKEKKKWSSLRIIFAHTNCHLKEASIKLEKTKRSRAGECQHPQEPDIFLVIGVRHIDT